jgi:solute carrier family 25 citrate transporter 1
MSFLKDEKGIPYKTLINGGIVGAVEAILTYPTEFIKTSLQLQSKVQPEYRGIWHCITKTVNDRGVFGLYRGLGPLVVGSIPKQGVRWFAYDVFSKELKDSNGNLTGARRAVAGFGAGAAEALFAVIPMETVKTKLIDDRKSANPQFKGSMDGVMKIVRKEGFLGIYRGVAATTLKQGLNQATRFPFQNFFMELLIQGDKSKKSHPLYNGLAGMGAGAVSVLVTQPADVIKTRMQSIGGQQMNFVSCGLDILKKDGMMFFYAGTAPRMLRVCFDVGATFAVFPIIQNAMDRYVWGLKPGAKSKGGSD